LKQHPVGRGPDLGTSLAIFDQVRESLDGLSRAAPSWARDRRTRERFRPSDQRVDDEWVNHACYHSLLSAQEGLVDSRVLARHKSSGFDRNE